MESNRCECGEVETTEHFLLDCPLYDDQRLELLSNLQLQAGLSSLDTYKLLSYEEKKDFPEWRETVIMLLCDYIEKTGRFKPNPEDRKA